MIKAAVRALQNRLVEPNNQDAAGAVRGFMAEVGYGAVAEYGIKAMFHDLKRNRAI